MVIQINLINMNDVLDLKEKARKEERTWGCECFLSRAVTKTSSSRRVAGRGRQRMDSEKVGYYVGAIVLITGIKMLRKIIQN